MVSHALALAIIVLLSSPAYDSDDVEELMEPSEDEIKEDQWLGVTVRSQGLGGKVCRKSLIFLWIINIFEIFDFKGESKME